LFVLSFFCFSCYCIVCPPLIGCFWLPFLYFQTCITSHRKGWECKQTWKKISTHNWGKHRIFIGAILTSLLLHSSIYTWCIIQPPVHVHVTRIHQDMKLLQYMVFFLFHMSWHNAPLTRTCTCMYWQKVQLYIIFLCYAQAIYIMPILNDYNNNSLIDIRHMSLWHASPYMYMYTQVINERAVNITR